MRQQGKEPSAASPESRVAAGLLGLIGFKERTLRRVRAGGSIVAARVTRSAPNAAFRAKFRVLESVVDGHAVYSIFPRDTAARNPVLYLHGGAYSAGFVKQHWDLFAFLCEDCGCAVVAPDYPLPPEADWTRAWSMVEQVYGGHSGPEDGAGPILMGDSAGGGFALSFAQALAASGAPRPAKLILLSPWLDLGLGNPAIAEVVDRDPCLSVEALRICGKRWAGATDPADPRLSPLYGSLERLPPLAVFSGTADVLNPDARKLHSMLTERGTAHEYHEYADMMHVWMLFDFPESRRARAELAAALR
ncbi:MAG: alpha/beta hydrolase fold domain-containing protein [Spirochaetaceae bacterium]|nr:alpha/beta hydrolase fold domain-containing protein [Spirochaetaceae bacterium]